MSENGNRNNSDGFRESWAKGSRDWDAEFEDFFNGKREAARARRAKQYGKRVHPEDTGSKGKTGYTWSSAKKEGNLDDETLFGLFASDTAVEIVNLLMRKQHDYGPNSVQNAPYGAVQGLITRLHDKLSRAANLTVNGRTSNNESLRDTFLDIAGYGIIGLMVLDGKFPQAKK